MGIFNDVMNLVDLGERVARGEGSEVLEELRGEVRKDREAREQAAAAPEPAKACPHAPAGYRCTGAHDGRGRCLTLEPVEAES